MDFNVDDKMYEALAEKLGVDIHAIELINPTIGEEIGSSTDEWHYGYYFEIPNLESIDEIVKNELKNLVDFHNFPFGETIYFSDGELSNTKADPFGWRSDFEYEQYYQKFILPQEHVIEEIDNINAKIKNAKDALIIKALIFSAFSITESYVRSLIWTKIPNLENSVSDEKLRELLQAKLSKELTTEKGRKEIYQIFTEKKLGAIPYSDPFRNSLAHDIGKAKIEDKNIIVTTKNGGESKKNIECIICALKDFIENLNK